MNPSAGPFVPFDSTLRDVLRTRFIVDVARWLLGGPGSVLAQAGNSSWESALTAQLLDDVDDILADSGEEPDLQRQIREALPGVVRWLLSQRTEQGSTYTHWEGVTWDTAWVLRVLMLALSEKHIANLDPSEIDLIHATCLRGVRWLHDRFDEWDTAVKYPFGPADVSQIVLTLIQFSLSCPTEAKTLCDETGFSSELHMASRIVEYLLFRRSEETLAPSPGGAAQTVVAYWWDDYFSTAEVLEALAGFCSHCEASSEAAEHRELLFSIREAIVRACTYFEKGQAEGRWGSHIDTLQVLHAYVLMRRLVPQHPGRGSDPFFDPEIHTTFKALRWMCDEKQIFSDGSFLHTMFLTVFYARALVEIYRSWEPATQRIDLIYDDVLWASPVRTTPERSKRLALEISNAQLDHELDASRLITQTLRHRLRLQKTSQWRMLAMGIIIALSLALFLAVGSLVEALEVSFRVKGSFYEYLTIAMTVISGMFIIAWRWPAVRRQPPLDRRASALDNEERNEEGRVF